MKLHISFSSKSILKVVRALAEHAFLMTMLLSVCALATSAVVFFVAQAAANALNDSTQQLTAVRFRQDVFLRVIKEWDERETQLMQIPLMRDRNVFSPSQQLTEE